MKITYEPVINVRDISSTTHIIVAKGMNNGDMQRLLLVSTGKGTVKFVTVEKPANWAFSFSGNGEETIHSIIERYKKAFEIEVFLNISDALKWVLS